MVRKLKIMLPVALALSLAGGITAAAEREERAPAQRNERPTEARPAPRQGEAHPGPRNYQRVTEPQGWNNRPRDMNRGDYQHNYQAARTFKIGPYHPPRGWTARRWTYGQILPRAYWAPQYLLADYWLFGLEVPPVGYEWVRDGADALLIDTVSGEILQVEYGVFA